MISGREKHPVARASGISRLNLETGSWDYFKPARALYKSHGFVECPPFADYVLDPNSVFMSVELLLISPAAGSVDRSTIVPHPSD